MRWAARLGWLGMACTLMLVLARPTAAEAAPRRVRLNIGPSGAESEAMAAVITELLQRLSVEVFFDRDGHDLTVDPHAYVAKVAVDLREPDYAVLFVEDAARDRLLAKRVVRAPSRQELVREEIGNMVLAAVEAVIAGASIGAPKAEAIRALSAEVAREREQAGGEPATQAAAQAPAQQPEREAEPSPSPSRTFDLSGALFYEVAALGDEPGVAHGPALALAVRSPWPLGLGVLATVQYRFPMSVEAEPIGLRSQVFALRALATVEHDVTSQLALRFGVGGGADIARLSPELAAGSTARTTSKRTLSLAVARALAGVDWRMSRWLSLWIAVAADFDLDTSQYVVIEAGGEARTVHEPWRVRPSLLVGAALP